MSPTAVKLEDITATSSVADFEAVLADDANIKTLMAEKKFGEFVKDYADAKTRTHQEVLTQVREEVQASIQEWVKESGGKLARPNLTPDQADEVRTKAQRAKTYNAKAPGAAIDSSEHAPADMAEFFQGIWHNLNHLDASEQLRMKQSEWKRIQNSYGSAVPADGGFLIPEVLRSEILQLALEESIVRPRAQIIPMSSLAVPIPTVDETSRASTVFGGMVAYWTEEGAAATVSQAKFGRVRLEAKKLTIYSEAPDELIADAPAFGGFIGANMPKAMAFEEDDAFITGNGVGQPKGVLHSSNGGLIKVPRATLNLVGFADVVNMFTRLLPGSYSNAVWMCSPAVIAQLLQLALTRGTDGIASPPLWLTGGQAIGDKPVTLLGRPLIVSEKVPNLGSTGDLALVDFSHYLIGDRQVMQASSSPHFKFSSDVTAFKIVERVDGKPWVPTPLTPRNGGPTLSPYVALSAATS
ncbi:phage major capsid protein [Jiangella alkaliphila]|uniref:Phage major capsid protein, HK97 family n=1 Tax=Jiangella alkaliphila TaxID=419479 RepID=A0A1H2IEK6_9ACTN|nr:phage major capsid protein [Jiangella alkaliphila]SDU42514.1 phage major capsid protein, HK97 family [Jiangella alkaliphila]